MSDATQATTPAPATQNLAPIFLLHYDVPEASNIQNPSNFLRRRCIRISMSAWIVRERDIPYGYLQRLEEAGARWSVNRFDPSETQKLAQTALDSVRRELRERREGLVASERAGIRRLEAARRRFDEAEAAFLAADTADQVAYEAVRDEMAEAQAAAEKAGKNYLSAAKAILRRNQKLVKDVTEACQRFGIEAPAVSVADLLNQAEAVSEGMKSRVAVYNEAITRLRAIGTADAVHQANLMAADDTAAAMPLPILADMMQDHAETQADADFADTLRGIFGR